MSKPDNQEPVLDIARGNKALSRYLVESLRLLRDRSDSDAFKDLVADVLEGRTSLRAVYNSPDFAAGIDPGVRKFSEKWDQLSQEDRDRMAEEGRATFDAENARIARESDSRSRRSPS